MRERESCLNPRPARVRGLDDDRPKREARHDRVAHRKARAGRRGVRPELRHDRTFGGDRLLQFGVLRRVGLVDAGADDGDRAGLHIERRRVRGCVDPCCQARDDRVTGVGEVHRDGPGSLDAGVCRSSAADHGQRPCVVWFQHSGNEQQRRSVVHRAEVDRVVGIEHGQQADTGCLPDRDIGGSFRQRLLGLVRAH